MLLYIYELYFKKEVKNDITCIKNNATHFYAR